MKCHLFKTRYYAALMPTPVLFASRIRTILPTRRLSGSRACVYMSQRPEKLEPAAFAALHHHPAGYEGQPLLRRHLGAGALWADGQFWLVYTDVKVTEGAFKDMTNYLTTAKDIRGPWSDPIKLNGVGFDASLFHDDDGRKYIVQQTSITGSTITLRWHYLNGAGYQDAEVNAGNRAHHLPRHRRGAGRGAAPL